jgi:hypothetical protein
MSHSSWSRRGVDGRVKPGHDGFLRGSNTYRYKSQKSGSYSASCCFVYPRSAQVVMAGLDPAIHENTVISSSNRLKIKGYPDRVNRWRGAGRRGWPAQGRP